MRFRLEEIEEAVLEGGIGFCTECGEQSDDFCEPDACCYTCTNPDCGEASVYGAEELLIMGLVD